MNDGPVGDGSYGDDLLNQSSGDPPDACGIMIGTSAHGVSDLTNSLKKEGVISGKEKGKIQRCAAKADIP